ncbi:hypothetical protein ACJMK2_011567 [Sinanodonta woodiana]|uniref:Uncharacterized protein n=1 Tax=Sinanodonta woodiana TaxID=1069815 RepID=A0ABD3V6P5_SINWO
MTLVLKRTWNIKTTIHLGKIILKNISKGRHCQNSTQPKRENANRKNSPENTPQTSETSGTIAIKQIMKDIQLKPTITHIRKEKPQEELPTAPPPEPNRTATTKAETRQYNVVKKDKGRDCKGSTNKRGKNSTTKLWKTKQQEETK